MKKTSKKKANPSSGEDLSGAVRLISVPSIKSKLTPEGYGKGEKPLSLETPEGSPLERALEATTRRSVAAWVAAARVTAHDADALRAAAPTAKVSPRTRGAKKSAGDPVLERLREMPTPTPRASPLAPEYFETFEHKSIAENLQGILLGGNPFKGADTASHALLRIVAGADANRPAYAALSVQSLDAAWRVAYQQQLQDLTRNTRLVLPIPLGNGVSLSYGEVVALSGDFYGSLQDLLQQVTPAVAAEVHRVTPQSTGTNLLTLTRGLCDFLRLAYANAEHFTPHNWAKYCRAHAQALLLALDRRFDAALMANAFADHFLTDAFAAGHMRTPREPSDGATEGLHARVMHNEENTQGLWVRNGQGLVWHAFGDDKLGFNPVHLLQTAVALGHSIQRVLQAYRLEGAQAAQVRQLAEAALTTLPAETVDSTKLPPLPDALPAVLGACGEAKLQSMAELLPLPLSNSTDPRAPDPGVLCNYAPLYRRHERGKRSVTPHFASYFLRDRV